MALGIDRLSGDLLAAYLLQLEYIWPSSFVDDDGFHLRYSQLYCEDRDKLGHAL